MKIQKQKKSKSTKRLIALAVVGILIVAGLAYWQYDSAAKRNQELTEVADKTSTIQEDQVKDPNENASGPDLPQKPSEQTDGSDEPSDSPDTPTGVTPEKPNLLRADDSKVVATFQKASSGKCELRLSKSGQSTIARTSSIVTGPSYYVCSFNVSGIFPSSGQWNAVVVHKIGSASTSSTIETIQVD